MDKTQHDGSFIDLLRMLPLIPNVKSPIERKAREQNMNDAQRLAIRQQYAVDILTDMGEWLKKEIGQLLTKSPIGKAIAYTLARKA